MRLGQWIAPLAVAAAFAAVGGCKDKETAAPSAPEAQPSGTVRVIAGDDGFEPNAVTFKKGAPASLVFVRTSDDTCATKVVFPELGIEKDLPKNTPVTIAIPTDKEQKLTFQCGMGMYKSSVVVGGS